MPQITRSNSNTTHVCTTDICNWQFVICNLTTPGFKLPITNHKLPIPMSDSKSFHMSPEEFRRQGHAVVDWIADYHSRVESFPVLSRVQPGEIRSKLPPNAPARGEAFDQILGDILSSGLGVQGMLWSTSPACTELETHVLDWLVPMLGLPEKFLSTSSA